MMKSLVVLGAVAVTMLATTVATRFSSPAIAAVPAPSLRAAATIDTVHSSLLFKIKHQDVAWFYGRFNEFSGTYALDPENADSGSVNLTIQAESVDTGNKKRDDHLRSQDFFSAREFPTITFQSSSVRKTGDNTFEATGDLSLHGITKEITVPVEFTGKKAGQRGELSGVHATFAIKRSDYGMNFMVGSGLGDEVTIIVSLEGRGGSAGG
jgi:polyisoprenoid-binding protein YceI